MTEVTCSSVQMSAIDGGQKNVLQVHKQLPSQWDLQGQILSRERASIALKKMLGLIRSK